MSKHTSGPWNNIAFSLSNEIATIENPLIAVVQSRYCESPEELRANANLIAAAPEMLEELQEAAKIFRNFERYHNKSVSDYLKHSEIEKADISRLKAIQNMHHAERIEIVIAKARGEV